jgi:hypothetical protein
MGHFNADELAILNSIKPDTILTDISYFKWHNLVVAGNAYVFIDKIELQFNNIPSVLLEINETDDGIHAKTNYDLDTEIKEIETKFNSKIRITQSNENKNEFWQDLINAPLISIEAEFFDAGYLNDSVVFNFGEQKRIIQFNREEGLLVDIYEEENY